MHLNYVQTCDIHRSLPIGLSRESCTWHKKQKPNYKINMKPDDKPNFDLQISRFKTLSTKEKDEIYARKKAKSTNDATKLWVNCFQDY